MVDAGYRFNFWYNYKGGGGGGGGNYMKIRHRNWWFIGSGGASTTLMEVLQSFKLQPKMGQEQVLSFGNAWTMVSTNSGPAEWWWCWWY